MDHLDVMAALRQLVGQLLHKYSIPAKMVRRVEGRHHAEAHTRLPHTARSSRGRSIVWPQVRDHAGPGGAAPGRVSSVC